MLCGHSSYECRKRRCRVGAVHLKANTMLSQAPYLSPELVVMVLQPLSCCSLSYAEHAYFSLSWHLCLNPAIALISRKKAHALLWSKTTALPACRAHKTISWQSIAFPLLPLALTPALDRCLADNDYGCRQSGRDGCSNAGIRGAPRSCCVIRLGVCGACLL